jgi:hypothetical protein
MKKLNLLYILCCFGFISQAQIQQENFNATTIPTGWTATNPASDCEWEFGYTGTLPGTDPNPATFVTGGVIFDDLACGASFNNLLELEGPTIDLVAAGIISAAVEIVYNHETLANDGDFLVEVWDGTAWQNIFTVSGDAPAFNSGTNETSTIDVTPYINSAFKVKFIYDDENSFTFGIGIDDYKLLDTAVAGISELERFGFNYYPNPITRNELTLHANEEISLINVYNSIGQRVISKSPSALESKLEMHTLATGVYIVQVAIGNQKGTFKVVKH